MEDDRPRPGTARPGAVEANPVMRAEVVGPAQHGERRGSGQAHGGGEEQRRGRDGPVGHQDQRHQPRRRGRLAGGQDPPGLLLDAGRARCQARPEPGHPAHPGSRGGHLPPAPDAQRQLEVGEDLGGRLVSEHARVHEHVGGAPHATGIAIGRRAQRRLGEQPEVGFGAFAIAAPAMPATGRRAFTVHALTVNANAKGGTRPGGRGIARARRRAPGRPGKPTGRWPGGWSGNPPPGGLWRGRRAPPHISKCASHCWKLGEKLLYGT